MLFLFAILHKKGHKGKMSKKTMSFPDLFIFLYIGAAPFLLHFGFDFLLGLPIEFINYCPEIYFINVTIFLYDNICFRKPSFKIKEILRFICLLVFMFSTVMYSFIYITSSEYITHPKFNLVFICLIVLTLLNFIFTVIITAIIYENNGDRHEIGYDEYSENRYEKYLLKRIDEKLNSIKNPKSEESEKEINDAKNSEELLNGSDILAEMLKNHIEIKEYFRISKNQSKLSFYFSIVSSVVGIIVIIIAAFGIAAFKEISIIAALSGAITEIISGIVLWIHNKSALQLNYYYDSLHENEKFLSAINIADKLSEEKKEDMYIEIIRKQIDIQVKNKESQVSDTSRK